MPVVREAAVGRVRCAQEGVYTMSRAETQEANYKRDGAISLGAGDTKTPAVHDVMTCTRSIVVRVFGEDAGRASTLMTVKLYVSNGLYGDAPAQQWADMVARSERPLAREYHIPSDHEHSARGR
jgi:hypothetical protein